jgi:hypothetical protein
MSEPERGLVMHITNESIAEEIRQLNFVHTAPGSYTGDRDPGLWQSIPNNWISTRVTTLMVLGMVIVMALGLAVLVFVLLNP